MGGGRRITGLPGVGGGVGVDGGVLADGAQHIGEFRLVLVGTQLGALTRFDGGVLQMVVDVLQAAELLHERQGGLLADARHAGNVVRRIAHQALHVDELGRGDAVFCLDGGGVHGDGFLVGGQQHRGGVVHQLQAVPVAGGEQRGTALGLAGGGQSAENVIGLPARLAHLHKTQVGQQFLQHRHLLGQFLRHAVAGGLVAVVGLVAEGGGALIPGDGHRIGLVGGKQVQEDVLEPEDRIGVAPVFRCQQFDAEEGAVDQTVAVQYHQFHRKAPLVHLHIESVYHKRRKCGRMECEIEKRGIPCN